MHPREDKTLLVAVAEDAAKYIGRACLEAGPYFAEQFRLSSNRPFVNFFLCVRDGSRLFMSYQDNYSVLAPGDFDPEPDLAGMVDKYANVGIPETSISMIRPLLVIANPAARDETVEAFRKWGYDQVEEVPRV